MQDITEQLVLNIVQWADFDVENYNNMRLW